MLFSFFGKTHRRWTDSLRAPVYKKICPQWPTVQEEVDCGSYSQQSGQQTCGAMHVSKSAEVFDAL